MNCCCACKIGLALYDMNDFHSYKRFYLIRATGPRSYIVTSSASAVTSMRNLSLCIVHQSPNLNALSWRLRG